MKKPLTVISKMDLIPIHLKKISLSISFPFVREEANKNQLEGIQNDGKNLLDQYLIPDVYFTIGLLSPSSKIRNKI